MKALCLVVLVSGILGCRPAHPYEPPDDPTVYDSDAEYHKARADYKRGYKEAAKDAEYEGRQY